MSEPVGNGPRAPIPSNSLRAREEPKQNPTDRIPLDKIVEGKVVVQKTPWYRRVAQSMIAEDAPTIGDYILVSVLVPALKNLVFDIVTQGTGRALYPGGRAVGPSGYGSRGGANAIREKYNEYSPRPGEQRRAISREERARHDFNNIILPDRDEAINVVSKLDDLVREFGQASLTDMYDLVGVTGSYADQRWGWTDLRDADVIQYRGGWLLDLPKPKNLRD